MKAKHIYAIEKRCSTANNKADTTIENNTQGFPVCFFVILLEISIGNTWKIKVSNTGAIIITTTTKKEIGELLATFIFTPSLNKSGEAIPARIFHRMPMK